MVSLAIQERSQARQAWEALVSRWAELAAGAERLTLHCVGFVGPSGLSEDSVQEWTRCALPGELLWTARAFAELGGETATALEHHDSLTLDTEQGLVPLVATRISTGAASVAPAHELVVGRRYERQVLEAELERVAEGQPPERHILLSGPAGMGKSTLLGELSGQAAVRGLREVQTRCVDYAQVLRLEPVGRLIASLCGVDPVRSTPALLRSEVETLCAQLDKPASAPLLLDPLDLPLDDAERAFLSRFTLMAQEAARSELLARGVQWLAARGPVLFVVEDLHWADAQLLGQLEAIMEAVADLPVLMVATTRPVPEAFADHARLSEGLVRLTLGPMSSHDARALAGRLSEQRRKPWQVQSTDFLDAEAVEQVLLRAAGNPLYLTQLLRLGAGESEEVERAASLDELFLRRTEELAPQERRLLEVAACIGFYFDAARPVQLAEAGPEVLQGLEVAKLVVRSGDDYRFLHALVRDAVLAAIPEPRRIAIQLALARDETDPLIRAERWADVGDPRAFDAFLELSVRRRNAYQWFPALAALDRAATVARSLEQRAEAGLARGAICEEQGEGLRSLESCLRVRTELTDAGAPDAGSLMVRARLGVLAAHRLLGQLGEAQTCIDLLRRTLDRPRMRAQAPLLCARFDYLRGAIAFSRGQLSLCQNAHGTALRTLEDAQPPHTEHRIYAQALSGMGDALYAQGSFLAARDVMSRCVELARARGMGRIEVGTRHMLGIATAYSGDARSGHGEARACWEQACQVGDARAMLFSELNVALTLFWDGRAREAVGACDGGTERAEWLGSSVLMGMTRSFTGHVRMGAKDREGAHRDSLAALEHLQHGGDRLYGCVCYGLALYLAAHEASPPSPDRAKEWISAGFALLESSVISHNYIYFALGLVPFAVRTRDADALWRLLSALRDFFAAELVACPDGAMAALVAWVELHADTVDGRTVDPSRVAVVQRHPMLRTRLAAIGRSA